MLGTPPRAPVPYGGGRHRDLPLQYAPWLKRATPKEFPLPTTSPPCFAQLPSRIGRIRAAPEPFLHSVATVPLYGCHTMGALANSAARQPSPRGTEPKNANPTPPRSGILGEGWPRFPRPDGPPSGCHVLDAPASTFPARPYPPYGGRGDGRSDAPASTCLFSAPRSHASLSTLHSPRPHILPAHCPLSAVYCPLSTVHCPLPPAVCGLLPALTASTLSRCHALTLPRSHFPRPPA